MGLFGRKDKTIHEEKESSATRAQRVLGQRPGAPDLSQLMEMAKQFSTPATGADGRSWVNSVVRPQTDFMRQCRCDQCGGPKRLPSPTGYMYCDYCGALIDFDFRALVRATSVISDRLQYAATMNEIGARSREARAAGNRDAYAQLRHRFYDAWLTATPQAASHRIGDPSYRTALVAYLVAGSVATDFDPSYQASEEQVKEAVLGIRRIGLQVDPVSFWPLLDAYMHQHELATALFRDSGVPNLDPDQTCEAVRHRIAMSVMLQGWMTALSPEAGEELVERTGLQGEYKHVEPITDGTTRHCGQCGAEFTALTGAKSSVCDHCGHRLDVGSAEWACNSCGGLMTMPSGTTETTCPYCKGLVSRVGR
jgi:DNA-directed RNA polymerase subunit RPC12/RpoP